MKKADKKLDFHVLAPHYSNQTNKYKENEYFTEHRFCYFWPAKYQRLAGRGIMPALENNKWLYLQIPFLFVSEFLALLRLTKHVKPDIIYAHWFTPQGVVAAIIASLTKRPWVLTSHASDVLVWNKVPMGGKIVRYFLPKAQAITAVSQQTLTRMKAFFDENKWEEVSPKVKVIPMGVDTSKFSKPIKDKYALKKEYGLDEKTVILFIGRLARIKGVEYLLQAFDKLAHKNNDLHLVIAGDGWIKKELEEQVKNFSLEEKVDFTGYISGDLKQDYFHLSDMVVVPSITNRDGDGEGLPVVIMESLAAGKICIASDASNGGVVIENKVNGYIVPEKDVDRLAHSIDAASSLKSGELKGLQQAAMDSSVALDWNAVAEQHIQHLLKNKNQAL
jgi:glycosyltransferase involved in cell wall biosynthesis